MNFRKSRIERSGKIEPLTPRIERFLKASLRGTSLDEDGDKEERPDFDCLGGLVSVEIKSLETSPTDRLQNSLKDRQKEDDWPSFYGSWPVEAVLKNLPDAKQIQRKLALRLGRTIERVVKKANSQLKAQSDRQTRTNVVQLLFLINEDHEEYSPEAVGFVLNRELARKDEDGNLKYQNLDAIIYFSERHASVLEGNVCFPILVMLGASVESMPWKREVIDLIARRWARWNNTSAFAADTSDLNSFGAFEHVPNSMPRHEKWRLDYRRKPYMRNWKNADVRNLWDHAIVLSLLAMGKGRPIDMPKEGAAKVFETFAHLMEEVKVRGLSLEYFQPTPERLTNAIDKLPYDGDAKRWLRTSLGVEKGDNGLGD